MKEIIEFKYKKIKIQDVKQDDIIKSYNIENDKIEPQVVEAILRPIVKKENQLKIYTKNGYIINSKKHPMMVRRNNKFIYIKSIDILIGDILLTSENKLEVVTKIEEPNLDEQFYDLTVAKNNNFFAGYNTLYCGHNSTTAYYPFYHREIEHIMVVGNNKGTEDNRVRDMDHAIIFNKLFYERYKNKEDITLFYMNDVPDLQSYNGFADEFKKRYEHYEQTIPKKRQLKIPAEKLFNRFLDERFLQSREYCLFADQFQTHGAFKIPVKISNLCTEISVPSFPIYDNINIKRNIIFNSESDKQKYYELRLEAYFSQVDDKTRLKITKKISKLFKFKYDNINAEVDETKDYDYFDLEGNVNLSEIGACILGGINLGMCKSEKRLKIVSEFLVRFLEELIDLGTYDLPEIEKAAKMRRTLGIGFSDVFHDLARNKKFYNTKEGRQFMSDKVELCTYTMIKTSIELAKEKGKCQLFSDTKYSDGIMPIDTREKHSDELLEVSSKLDWESLRKELIKHGMRHSTLFANAPYGSSSIVSNSTPGLEPPRDIANIKEEIVKLVPDIKYSKYYTLVWDDEFNNIDYFKFVAVFQRWMDQTISTNQYSNLLKYNNGKVPKSRLIEEHLVAMYYGLETMYYSNIRSTDRKDGLDDNDIPECSGGGCHI